MRWLVQKGKHDEARNVLRKLRSVTCNIEEELKEIVNVCKKDEQVLSQSQNSEIEQDNTSELEREPFIVGNNQAFQNSFCFKMILLSLVSLSLSQATAEGGGSWSRLSQSQSVRKALLIGVSLQLFQQLAGINTVIYYSARILQMSGISNSVSTILWISCGVNAINFFASFIGDKEAEKPLD